MSIQLNKLTESDKGRLVVYTPFEDCDSNLKERGVITSWNDMYVFVRYGSDIHSKSTNPDDLDFIS